MQKYDRSTPFSEEDWIILKLSELRVVAFAQFAKKGEKDYCDFVDIAYQQLISHSVTRWLSLYRNLPRMLQLYPVSHSYFIAIDKFWIRFASSTWNAPRFWNTNNKGLQLFQKQVKKTTQKFIYGFT